MIEKEDKGKRSRGRRIQTALRLLTEGVGQGLNKHAIGCLAFLSSKGLGDWGGGGPASWLGHALLWQPSFVIAVVHGADADGGGGRAAAEAAACALAELTTNGHRVGQMGREGTAAALVIEHAVQGGCKARNDGGSGDESGGGVGGGGGKLEQRGGTGGGHSGESQVAAAERLGEGLAAERLSVSSSSSDGGGVGVGGHGVAGPQMPPTPGGGSSEQNGGMPISPTSLRPVANGGLTRHSAAMIGASFRVNMADAYDRETPSSKPRRSQSLDDGGWEEDDDGSL